MDFLCSHKEQKLDPKLTACGIKQFAQHVFEHVPFLQKHLPAVDQILEDWKQYKLTVPTYGAILISEDLKHVLLVQSYFAKSSWGFPKGKINENEQPLHCAVREVYEETGYDISKQIQPNEYIELVMNFQYSRLYLVVGVKMSTKFEPKTRNEIKCCEWFPVEHLPLNKYQVEAKTNLGIGPNSFFMILPFIKRLKRWLAEYGTRKEEKNKPPVAKKNRINSNISTFHYDEANASTSGANLNSTFFADNQKSSNFTRRQRNKSTSDVEVGFKLANFALPEKGKTSTPKEPRRKLVFTTELQPPNDIAIESSWTNFAFDRQKLMDAVFAKLHHIF